MGLQLLGKGPELEATILLPLLKPIFHCDAKPFALGPAVGLDPQRYNFVLGIPTCWYLKTLKFALPPTIRKNLHYPGPYANSQREPVEYSSHWVSQSWFCIGHVDFMLFVLFLVELGIPRKCKIQWNTGYRLP